MQKLELVQLPSTPRVHRPHAHRRRLTAMVLAALCWVALSVTPVSAQQCFNDVQGADDLPGQKDLSDFCLTGTCTGGGGIAWQFDDTGWSGNNTGDACAFYDTNGNGFADRAVCATLTGEPPSLLAGSPTCYTCNDSRPDRCGSAVAVSCTSTCALTSSADPFSLNPSHT